MQNTGNNSGTGYTISGIVVTGNQLGRKLGFPTANLKLPEGSVFSAETGVYAVYVCFEGQKYNGICNAGFRPTFDHKTLTIEVHLLNFSGDLYGKKLEITFIRKLRDERRFSGPEDLKLQISKDRETAMQLFSGGN